MPFTQFSLLLPWFTIISIVGIAAMGIDKLLAMGRHSRISERSLWLVALLGGFPGIFAGGFLFHHKTSKLGFWAPVIASAVLWILAIALWSPS
jgi:uncharacterized membrane protein YsdA (DUF1294 family)